MTVNANLLERREYKYLVTPKLAEKVRHWIQPFCNGDPYAGPDGTYEIDSLYLDTPDFSLFRANERELVDRVKLRIRSYPAMNHDPLFLEVKRRVNDVVAKTRAKVPAKILRGLMEHGTAQLMDSIEPKSRRAAERFLCYAVGHHMRPRVLVRYTREPWMSTIDDYARVTFDSRIRSCDASDWNLLPERKDWKFVDHAVSMGTNDSRIVLELKFESERMPFWMSTLVQSLHLQRRSFSKYCRSIEAWYAPSLASQHRVAS